MQYIYRLRSLLCNTEGGKLVTVNLRKERKKEQLCFFLPHSVYWMSSDKKLEISSSVTFIRLHMEKNDRVNYASLVE